MRVGRERRARLVLEEGAGTTEILSIAGPVQRAVTPCIVVARATFRSERASLPGRDDAPPAEARAVAMPECSAEWIKLGSESYRN